MILSLLRERTSHLHERVERAVDLPTRLRSLAAYTFLMARFHGFYAPLEDRLAGVVGYDGVGLSLAARQKARLLRDDLSSLGLTTADVDAFPSCHDLPSIADLSEALGCLYVLEGATLGGQIVRRQVERRHGLSSDHGCSFFSSYGERVGAMWKEFCEVLERYATVTPGAGERIVAAAAATFSCLDRWLAGDEA